MAFLFSCLLLIPTAYSANGATTIQKTISYDSVAITVRKVPPKEIERLLNDSDYSYNRVSKTHKTIFDRFLEWLMNKLGESVESNKAQISLTAIQYLFVALAFGLIVFLLLKNNIRSLFYGKSATTKTDFAEATEDINEIDFEQRIANEVSRRDFRRAIRLHFLRIIKELSEQKLINWQLDKTNTDYSRELRNSKYSREFEELIRLYEYIWYGDFKLDEANFLLVIQKFNQFKINQ